MPYFDKNCLRSWSLYLALNDWLAKRNCAEQLDLGAFYWIYKHWVRLHAHLHWCQSQNSKVRNKD